MSRLVWVAVPGGRGAGGTGVLRVLVIPMLDGGGGLAEEGMGSWPPAALLGEHARVRVTASESPGATPDVSSELEPRFQVVPDLWQEFFTSIEVHPPGGGMAREIDVDPTTEHADHIISTYSDAARAITTEGDRPGFEASVPSRLEDFPGITRGRARPDVDVASDSNRGRRTVDFHLATSVLREHPAVLTSLGLIFELEIPRADVERMAPRGVVQVSWPAAPETVPEVAPRWTSLLRDRFLPAPRDGSDLHAAGGMVALARSVDGMPAWRLHTVDVDHALGTLADAATASSAALPALRTAGVLLTRAGRAADLDRRGSRNATRDAAAAETPLTADDLVLGYRVDTRLVGGDWHSLCERLATYTVNTTKFAVDLEEEGHVKVGGGVDYGDATLRTDEVVARWDGWSLAAPRPSLRPQPTRRQAAGLPFHLATDLRARPGSLLKLRFGADYQVRARVADLTGGGPMLSEASLDGCDSGVLRFRRLEPLLPPDVRLVPGAGSFGPGAGAFSLVTREGVADAPADTARELVPPSATFEVIERHGKLDGDAGQSLELLSNPDLADPASGGVVGFVGGAPGEPPLDLEPMDWKGPWPDLGTKRLVLRKRSGREPTLQWEDDGEVLVIRLSPAEEADLEISSLIDEGSKTAFSISDWLSSTDGGPASVGAAETLLAAGRHPMATPAQRMVVRHAVRLPMGTPAGSLRATRVEASTSALLEPDGPSMVGVHAPSTAAVEVRASWAPVEDLEDAPVTNRSVGRIPVGRADQALAPLVHEFGDTKHRMVDYELTALSRYRDCFVDAERDEDFQTVGTVRSVTVRSSARPAPPVVRSTTPAFVWQEERQEGGAIVRRRLGNRIRVELARPWFTTGDGERLAVVTGPADSDPALAALVTQAGRDPVWNTGVPPQFPAPLGSPVQVPLAEGGVASVFDHGVFQAGDSWYADVAFAPTDSYSPLVQLAVARHQPTSLPGLELSQVVRTDFVPLLPDRTLMIEVADGRVHITLSGLTPSGPQPNRFVAMLERRVADLATQSTTLTVGDASVWEPFGSLEGLMGNTLRLDAPDGTAGLRVRVREVESIGIDRQAESFTLAELSERVVFTDTVEL